MAKTPRAGIDRFFTLSRDLFVIAGFDGCFRFLNGGWEKTLGYPAAELLGKPYIDLVHPDDREATRAEAAKLAEGHETIEFENRYRRKDGAWVWLCWNASSVIDEQALYCVARDVTERKRAEEALRAAHAQMERRVEERTAELTRTNAVLEAEIGERERAEAKVRKQQDVIRELSTPVLPVSQGLLIVPVIGAVDSSRAAQLTEQLLRSVRANRAKAAVIDVTGVVTVDTAVANHLIQTAQACKLLGATVIITGISKDIALTLVQLGVSLSEVTTKVDLRSGIEEAHQMMGKQLMPFGEQAAERRASESEIPRASARAAERRNSFPPRASAKASNPLGT